MMHLTPDPFDELERIYARIADSMADRIVIQPTADDARARGDEETARKWEAMLSGGRNG